MGISNQPSQPKNKRGCLRAFGIALLVFVIIIVLMVVLALLLTAPGKQQLSRLEGFESASTSDAPRTGLESTGAVIEVPQELLSRVAGSTISEQFQEIPNVEFLGFDVRMDQGDIDLLAGVEGVHPVFNVRRKATVGIRAGLSGTEDGFLAIQPRSVRFGRLPLPVALIFNMDRRIPAYESLNSRLESAGFRLDAERRRFLVDTGIFLSEAIPGAEVKSVAALPGRLRIGLKFPDLLEASLVDFLKAAGKDREILLRNLDGVLPEENGEILDLVESVFAAVEVLDTASLTTWDAATVSYLDGIVDTMLPGAADVQPVGFGDRVPVGARVICGKDSFAELVFPGDQVVKISENSEMVVGGTMESNRGQTSVSLFSGKARVLVSALTGNQEFELTAFEAVMAVRGTDFAVVLGGRGKVKLAVLEGRVEVNDQMMISENQSVIVDGGRVDEPVPLDPEFAAEIEEHLGIRTERDDIRDLGETSILSLTVPQVMEAAAIWADLDNDTQWDVQSVVEDYVENHPEVAQAVDEFFRVNDLEDRRAEFERMFE